MLGAQPLRVFACLRSALLSAVLPFGQKPAHLVSVALFPLTRQKPARFVVVRRSLHSVVPLQQIIAFCHFVPKRSCLLTKTASLTAIPPLRAGCAPINCFRFTPSFRSLRLWCIRGVRRFVTQCLITLCVLASPAHRQQGALDRFAPRLRRLAKLSPTLEVCGIKRRARPNKTLLHCAPFFMREFVALSCGFLPRPPP